MILFAAAFFGIFGLLSIAGGALGFRKAKSRASLLAGGISGALLLVAAASLLAGSLKLGLIVGGITSLLLAVRFVPGYLATRRWMPQGMMALFSTAGVLVAAAAWSGLPAYW